MTKMSNLKGTHIMKSCSLCEKHKSAPFYLVGIAPLGLDSVAIYPTVRLFSNIMIRTKGKFFFLTDVYFDVLAFL